METHSDKTHQHSNQNLMLWDRRDFVFCITFKKVGEILQACKMHLSFRALWLLDQLHKHKTNEWVQLFHIIVEYQWIFFADAWKTVFDGKYTSWLKFEVMNVVSIEVSRWVDPKHVVIAVALPLPNGRKPIWIVETSVDRNQLANV